VPASVGERVASKPAIACSTCKRLRCVRALTTALRNKLIPPCRRPRGSGTCHAPSVLNHWPLDGHVEAA